jgi:hypothetical protein
MILLIELFICSRMPDGNIHYHRVCRSLSDRSDDPDVVLEETLDELGMDPNAGVVCAHSTSWRYESGCTILTYLVWVQASLLDGMHCRNINLEEVNCSDAAGPTAPRPIALSEEHVLAHGLRHLSYLVCKQRQPLMSHALLATNALEPISRLSTSPPGRIGGK